MKRPYVLPLFQLLELRGIALAQAEESGFYRLASAAQRCASCDQAEACGRWLKWRGHYGEPPPCPNADYIDELSAQ